jgi:hypothetical protein
MPAMTLFLEMVLKESGATKEKIAQKNKKKRDAGRVTRKVQTRLIASLHHFTTSPLISCRSIQLNFIQALIFGYFVSIQSNKKEK